MGAYQRMNHNNGVKPTRKKRCGLRRTLGFNKKGSSMIRNALIVAVLSLSIFVIKADARGNEYRKIWKSKDSRLSISGSLLVEPKADPTKQIAIISIGSLATFKHSGGASVVTGQARLILYYADLQRLELHGSARLKEGKNSYSAHQVIYDLPSQTVIPPTGGKYLIKPRNSIYPNQGFNSDAAKGAARG